jgi:hypothetical protein
MGECIGTSSATRRAKNKLHLRPRAAEFLLQRILQKLSSGDVAFVLGWNATFPDEEFLQQRCFAETMLSL